MTTMALVQTKQQVTAQTASQHVVTNDSHGNSKSPAQQIWEKNLQKAQAKTDADTKALIQTKKDYDAQQALKKETTTSLKKAQPVDIIKLVRSMDVTGKTSKPVSTVTTQTNPTKRIQSQKTTAWQATQKNLSKKIASQRQDKLDSLKSKIASNTATSQKIATRKNPMLKVLAPFSNTGLSPLTLILEAGTGLLIGAMLPLIGIATFKRKGNSMNA